LAFPLHRVVVLLEICAAVLGAQDAATLSGTVIGPGSVRVTDAEVALLADDRGEVGRRRTNINGRFLFTGLAAGEYTIEVSKQGFDTLELRRLRLHINDRRSLHLDLSASEGEPTTVTVTADVQGVSSDLSFETTFEPDYINGLPLQSRTPTALLSMAPGVTVIGDGGKPAAHGLPARLSYVTLDGVSSDSLAGRVSSIGGDAGLISLEALEEVQVRVSVIAPEFGRTPGTQVSLASRAGTNVLHGSLYEYLGNDKLNANDWFANRAGLPRGKTRRNNFGLTVGGPLLHDRTYFFASYEGRRFLQPRTAYSAVPDLDARAAAPADLQPFLSAFPLPNGSRITDGIAEVIAVVENRADTDAAGLRVDHRINSTLTLFTSYRYGASDRNSRGFAGIAPNVITSRGSRAHAATVALTWAPSPQIMNEFRANVSTSSLDVHSTMDSFGGAVPLTDAQVFPDPITSATGSLVLKIGGAGGYSFGGRERTKQRQLHVRNTLSVIRGDHSLSFGIDFQRLTPTYFPRPYSISPFFNGITGGAGSLLSGVATNTVVSSGVDAVYPLYQHFSTYFQDTWRATNRTTVTWGLRWEANPAPDVVRGSPPLAQSDDGPTRLNPLYRTRWLDFAPRAGLAYQMDTTPGREMVFRAGIALFHDNGISHAIGAFGGAPYVSERTLTAPVFPLSASNLDPPALPTTEPYGRLNTSVINLPTPEFLEWNAAFEKMFGWGGSLSIGYFGTRGRDLPRSETNRFLLSPDDTAFSDYDVLQVTYNGSRSDYHGVQMQLRRRLHRSLQTQVSYTYGHSIDTIAYNTVPPGFATIPAIPSADRNYDIWTGDSDFDVRHTLSVSGSYNLPAPKSGFAHKLLRNWWTDWMITARTGLPLKIRGVSALSSDQHEVDEPPFGLYAQIRPNTTGKPIWLRDPQAATGLRLNPEAFALPEDYEQGVLGRNVVRGFSQYQADLAIRRRLSFTERVSLDVMAQAFNILNHPSFADPSPGRAANLASPNFGVTNDMLNQSFGGGASSQYRMGGPRSLQFALRLVF